jgi:hypothetical protein
MFSLHMGQDASRHMSLELSDFGDEEVASQSAFIDN